MIDRNGEPLEANSRVMLDGALLGTVVSVDDERGTIRVHIDGEPVGSVVDLACVSIGWKAGDVESLGDGINQAMRAASGRPA